MHSKKSSKPPPNMYVVEIKQELDLERLARNVQIKRAKGSAIRGYLPFGDSVRGIVLNRFVESRDAKSEGSRNPRDLSAGKFRQKRIGC